MQNKRLLGMILVFLGVPSRILLGQNGQTQNNQAQATQSQGGLGGMMGGLGNKGGIAVQTTDPIDSNGSSAGRAYRASIARAASVNGISVPQGSLAVLTLQQANNGWSINLTAISAGGMVIPITGGMASLKGGGLMNAMSDPSNILNGGIFGRKQKPAANTPAAIPTSISGARVYLPANTNILFLNTKSSAQAPQNAQNAPPAQQLPTTQPTTQPITQPVSYQPGQQTAGSQNPNFQSPSGQSFANPAGGNSVIFKSIQYQLTGCHREAPHIVCELQVMNTGATDTALKGDVRTYYIDQAGNKNLVKSATVANCNLGVCEMLPQLSMKARYIFADETGEAKTMVRLQFWAGGEQVAQFQNVPVQ